MSQSSNPDAQWEAASDLTVDDLLVTSELSRRPLRPRHDRATDSALRILSREIAEDPTNVLQSFVGVAMQLCGGGSAGISVYEPETGAGIFRWHGLTGRAAPFNGETTPRDFSPCGICLDRGEIILMDRPGRYYGWLNLPGLPLTEALLVPLLIRGKAPFGTLWVMSHDDHRFDKEDERVLAEISSVACLSLGMIAEIADNRARLERSQAALHEANKLEALGHLTAGIAHDFNNLLTVMTGELELIQMRTSDDKLARMADRGMKAAARGEKLVQRLMAFSRRKPSKREVVDLRLVLQNTIETFRQLFPGVVTRDAVADDLWPVFVDQNQLESAVLNLALNAKDAMAENGTLTISAQNARFEEDPDDPGMADDFVTFAVADTGMGMSPEVLKQAFEPFFTTKGVGIGTGLGLSLVHDFVVQSAGIARIASEPGKGTSVTIHLPRAKATATEPV